MDDSMPGCFGWMLLFALAVFTMVSLLRWFELAVEAIDERRWQRVALLVIVPPSVWCFESKVSASRPVAVPRHEPVRGFGGLPKGGINPPGNDQTRDQPPPGTPKEFIGLPSIPSPKPRKNVDPDKLEKLRQKMKEQGMLRDDSEPESGERSSENS